MRLSGIFAQQHRERQHENWTANWKHNHAGLFLLLFVNTPSKSGPTFPAQRARKRERMTEGAALARTKMWIREIKGHFRWFQGGCSASPSVERTHGSADKERQSVRQWCNLVTLFLFVPTSHPACCCWLWATYHTTEGRISAYADIATHLSQVISDDREGLQCVCTLFLGGKILHSIPV